MRTNIDIDDALIERMMQLNPNLKTKRDAVNFALWNTVQSYREFDLFKLAESDPIDPNYHYKAYREDRA